MIGQGPPHFKKHFKVEAGRTFKDPRQALKGPIVVRSILGLLAVYNLLPEDSRAKEPVKDFQAELQKVVSKNLQEGNTDWKDTLSLRVPMKRHPLRDA